MEGVDQFALVVKLVGGGVPIPPNTASANLIGRAILAAVRLGAKRPALLEAVGINEATIRNQLSRVPGVVLNQPQEVFRIVGYLGIVVFEQYFGEAVHRPQRGAQIV